MKVYIPATSEYSTREYEELQYVEYARVEEGTYTGLDIDYERLYADVETGLIVKNIPAFERWVDSNIGTKL